MQLVDGPGAVAGNFQYAQGAIDPESVERFAAEHGDLLRAALADPEAPPAAACERGLVSSPSASSGA